MDVDLNADLGEGEPWSRTRALLLRVTSANIACGGHAGTPGSMERTVAAALGAGVRIGAHPGLPGGFGRGEVRIEPEGLQLLLLHQVGALAAVARRCGTRLHHVKLHGSLYHAADGSTELARSFVEGIHRWFPGLRIFARPDGEVATQAGRRGVAVWPEGFADRGYRPDGSLVPRGMPGALLERPGEVAGRIRAWRRDGAITATDGSRIRLPVRTWCVHGDTRGAVAMAGAVLRALRGDIRPVSARRARVRPGSRPSGPSARAGR